ncbi:hypothetical protein D3C81_1406690 [compost metagenome]
MRRRRHHVATGEQILQAGRNAVQARHPFIHQAGGEPEARHPMHVDEAGKRVQFERVLAMQDQGAAVEQGAPDFQRGGVER